MNSQHVLGDTMGGAVRERVKWTEGWRSRKPIKEEVKLKADFEKMDTEGTL